MAYTVASPEKLEGLLDHPVLGKSLGMMGYTNYIFPTTPEGVTLPEYDKIMLEMVKKKKRAYFYMIHAKFIRDATGQQIEDLVKRICLMAKQMKARMMVTLGAIAPGTDLEKIDLLLDCVDKYGRYAK